MIEKEVGDNTKIDMTAQFFYRSQTKFAKVMFLHLSVSHSVHGGGESASVHAGIADPLPPERHSPPSWEQTPKEQTSSRSKLPQEQTPPEETPAQCMLGDMANKWVVHIQLECILVFFFNSATIVIFVIFANG